MTCILLADDQALVRAGFRMILEAQPDLKVVGEAGDGAEAVTLTRQLQPDIVLMDVRMPGVDGIEATRRLAQAGGTARVLMLTTFDHDDHVYESFRAGASGFLLKNAPPEQLVAAVRTVAAGEALLAPAITRRLIEEFVARPRIGSALPNQTRDLSPRELEVLRLIAGGLSNAEIGARLFIGEGTVKTHVTHILAKLGLRDRIQAVVLAYETGLVQPGHSAEARRQEGRKPSS
jgi:DNA-binding NarL/FixJ family response regulator